MFENICYLNPDGYRIVDTQLETGEYVVMYHFRTLVHGLNQCRENSSRYKETLMYNGLVIYEAVYKRV